MIVVLLGSTTSRLQPLGWTPTVAFAALSLFCFVLAVPVWRDEPTYLPRGFFKRMMRTMPFPASYLPTGAAFGFWAVSAWLFNVVAGLRGTSFAVVGSVALGFAVLGLGAGVVSYTVKYMERPRWILPPYWRAAGKPNVARDVSQNRGASGYGQSASEHS